MVCYIYTNWLKVRRLLKNLSIKQGKKFDDPASKDEIEKFIAFHGLDMSEVLLPVEEFKNFNEFFYRALKPTARPCSAPENPKIIVSPADCRSVVFNQMTQATKIWVKGREFNIKRLLGDAYPDDAARYENGALGVFRLAPQDYHRFHVPVDGVMGEPKMIAGEYYTVNPMAIRSALDVYGENVRVLVPVDSVAHGRVMIVCVGAMMVGSTIITRKPGEHVKRAEELGYFKFGGSTLLVLFEPGKMRWDDDLVDNSNGALETLVSDKSAWQGVWMQELTENVADSCWHVCRTLAGRAPVGSRHPQGRPGRHRSGKENGEAPHPGQHLRVGLAGWQRRRRDGAEEEEAFVGADDPYACGVSTIEEPAAKPADSDGGRPAAPGGEGRQASRQHRGHGEHEEALQTKKTLSVGRRIWATGLDHTELVQDEGGWGGKKSMRARGIVLRKRACIGGGSLPSFLDWHSIEHGEVFILFYLRAGTE